MLHTNKVVLHFRKTFKRGNLEGTTITDHINFTDEHRAMEWWQGMRHHPDYSVSHPCIEGLQQ